MERIGRWTLPDGAFDEADEIPDFWVTSVAEVAEFLTTRVRRGGVRVFGASAGGRPLRAVSYGEGRGGRQTTTFNGALGYRDIRAWFGAEHEKKVYVGLGAVHGGEFEGIAGMVNLLAVLETGQDLRGKPWPQLTAAAERLDRIVIIPILNVDGRDRLPLRMIKHRGTDKSIIECLNTGSKLDGTMIGWPQCKEHIPVDFDTVGFPGGYPNDAGVNLQHDDVLGHPQPETRALLDLLAAERPDLVINMHTGAPPKNYYTRTHQPQMVEPKLEPVFADIYVAIHTALTEAGLQGSRDVTLETVLPPKSVANLDTAINFHTGALSVLIESPSHGFSGHSREGEVVLQTADSIVDAQLTCHAAAMQFLADTGGRTKWTPPA